MLGMNITSKNPIFYGKEKLSEFCNAIYSFVNFRTLAILLLITFVSMTAFSVLSMTHDIEHEEGCVASAIGMVPCPKDDTNALLSLHSGFINLISTFLISVSDSSLLPLVVFLGLISLALVSLSSLLPFSVRIPSRFRDKKSYSGTLQRLLEWLALKYISPALA